MESSKDDLDMKAIQQLFSDCYALPKIELHAHIGGCLRAETFLELAESRGVNTDSIDFYNVDIKSAFEIFRLVSLVLVDLNTLERVVREIVKDYAKQNCVYLELRSTPKVFKAGRYQQEESSIKDYVDRVIKAIKDAEEEHDGKIRVRYIPSINRSAPVDHARQVVDLALTY